MGVKAIVNAKIVSCFSSIMDKGIILWDDDSGKILYCGEDLKNIPKQAEISDLDGCIITPGFIDAHTHIGIQESVIGSAGDDLSENHLGAVTPFINAADSINFNDAAFDDALSGGVTTVSILTGSGLAISGTGCIVKTAGDIENRFISEISCLKGALGEIPKNESKYTSSATSRGGNISVIRDCFYKAIFYSENKEMAIRNNTPFLKQPGYEAVCEVLKGNIPFRIHAFRSDDILSAIKLSEEFGINIIIEHGLDAVEVLNQLSEKGIPVCFGTALSWRYSNETRNTGYSTVPVLLNNGVKTALITDHGCTPIEHLLLLAQLAVKEGVSWEDGIKLITIYPAQILGIDNRVGSLKEGNDTDFNVFSGDPFHYTTKLKKVYINGREAWNTDRNEKRWY
ncbi:MAG: amidohydrolase family protein [Clostridiales bacterium]|nr:amidohydrolase family protein [Clostridiales bacterium]